MSINHPTGIFQINKLQTMREQSKIDYLCKNGYLIPFIVNILLNC